MSETPEFISQSVLSRVREGRFVASRKARRKEGRDPNDRRRVFSPLSITKRCIRYDHNVFSNRREQVLQMADALNDGSLKMLMVSGLQGAGKTSMVRGVIELMGGKKEQLLWFDVNRHTDFEEIIQFLIQYITYIGQSLRKTAPSFSVSASRVEAQRDPLRELDSLIREMADVPLLIVLDNVEYIVDSDFRFNSYPFKEMLNFLLGFGNIKMLMIGERLPYADISPNQPGVSEIKLNELSREDVTAFLSRKTEEPLDAEVLGRLCDKSLGMPWLLKLLYYLNRQLALHVLELERHLSEGESLIGEMTDYIFRNLTPDEQKLFQTLALLRHPVNFETLLAVTRRCFPDFDPKREFAGAKQLEASFIRPVLKISFPPQQVLAEIREGLEKQAAGAVLTDEEKLKSRHEPWYELYRQVKKLLYGAMSDLERSRLHGILQDYYLAEKNRPVNERVANIKSRALLSEAKHHSMAARKRREAGNLITGGTVTDVPSFLPQTTTSEASPETRAYLERQTSPLSTGRTYTLDDYKGWPVPGSPPDEGAPISMDGLALTDEERELLYGTAGMPQAGGVASVQPVEHARAPESRPTASPESSVVQVQFTPESRPSKSEPVQSPAPQTQQQTETPPVPNTKSVDETEKPLLERLSDAVARQDKAAFVLAMLTLGQHRLGRGELARAEECLHKAEALKTSLDAGGQAELYRLQGGIYKGTFRHNEAESVFLRALECLPSGSPEAAGDIHQQLGDILAYRGQHVPALAAFAKALQGFASDTARQAEVYFAMAEVYDESGQPERALQAYDEALSREGGNDLACAATLANMGSILLELERLDEAEAAFEASLSHDRKAQHPQGQIKTLEALARLHWEEGQLHRAEAHLQQALGLSVQEGQPLWQANLYLKLGDLYAEQGQLDQARLQYERARSSAEHELSEPSLRWIEEKLRRL